MNEEDKDLLPPKIDWPREMLDRYKDYDQYYWANFQAVPLPALEWEPVDRRHLLHQEHMGYNITPLRIYPDVSLWTSGPAEVKEAPKQLSLFETEAEE